MKTQSTMFLGLALALAPGCYSGLDSSPGQGAGGAADGADGAADGADGADDAPADDGTPQEPDPDDPNAPPFRVPGDEARLLPFPVRMTNLAYVTGQTPDHPMFGDLVELRFQLGDHDFASGVAPDLRWSAEKMQYWVRGLKPVCASAEMAAAYPELLTDPRPMMRKAWGHEPSDEEAQAMTDLQDGTVPADQQFMVTCLAVLTALDFVSI